MRLKEGAGQFVNYFGKSAPAGENEFLVPEAGGIVKRLRESMKLFIDDFGKKAPELKPGEMGDFEFLLKDEPIYTRFGRELKGAAKDFRRDPRGLPRDSKQREQVKASRFLVDDFTLFDEVKQKDISTKDNNSPQEDGVLTNKVRSCERSDATI